MILGFAGMGVVHVAVHVAMTVPVALSVRLLRMIISDLDHPFHGAWNIDLTPLDTLSARFANDAAPA